MSSALTCPNPLHSIDAMDDPFAPKLFRQKSRDPVREQPNLFGEEAVIKITILLKTRCLFYDQQEELELKNVNSASADVDHCI